MLDLSVIILARNEELHIRRCLENILPVAKEVFVIDCFSTDNTTAICREYPRVKVIQHEWPGLYALQFNWALDNWPITAEWVLRLDADEWFMPEALEELKEKLPALSPDVTGIIHKRRHIFLGRWMKHGVYPVKLLRLFRYAHRGYHDKPRIPENSMAAFRRAIENGFGAELDVHLMKDGRLAVIHDASLKRTAGADMLVEDLTAEELKTYRLEGTDEQIPLLEEVLPIFAGKAPLVVELKAERGNADALAAAACRLLDKYRVTYCIESFDPRCLMWLWANRPDVVRGQLSENFRRHGDAENLPGVVRWVLSNLLLNARTRPDFIAYRFEDRKSLSLRLCRGLYGAQEFSWTIRSKETMDAAERDGALVIFECFDPRG